MCLLYCMLSTLFTLYGLVTATDEYLCLLFGLVTQCLLYVLSSYLYASAKLSLCLLCCLVTLLYVCFTVWYIHTAWNSSIGWYIYSNHNWYPLYGFMALSLLYFRSFYIVKINIKECTYSWTRGGLAHFSSLHAIFFMFPSPAGGSSFHSSPPQPPPTDCWYLHYVYSCLY